MKRHVPAAALALALAASTLATPSQAQQRYEQPDLNASALAPKALLQGTGYTVDERVTFESFMPRFTIRSRHGVWEARGREMLDIRVSELSALSQLAEVSKGDEFASALGKAAVAPVKVAGDLVTKPLDTTGKLVSGAGIMLGRVGSFVGSTAANTGTGSAAPTTDARRSRRAPRRSRPEPRRRACSSATRSVTTGPAASGRSVSRSIRTRPTRRCPTSSAMSRRSRLPEPSP